MSDQSGLVSRFIDLAANLDPDGSMPRETIAMLVEYGKACRKEIGMDFAAQNIQNNIPMMRLETYVSAQLIEFDGRYISIPVTIDFSVRLTNDIQNPSNITITVAGSEDYEWNDLSYFQQEIWRAEMLKIWNAKYGMILQKVTA